MAKNNFKAKEATSDANYAQGIGQAGQAGMATGADQQRQGFQNLQDTFGQQKSFADMLQSAAAGTGGPTMADQQIKDATARNNANAAGFAASAKGLNPALAARQALMAQAGNNQQAAGQAAQTRVQEQLAARSQLGGALAGQAATAGGQTSAGQGMFGTGGSLANQSNQNLISSRNSANQINADVSKQNAGVINGMIGGVMNAAGGALGLAEGGVVPGEAEGTQSDETSIALAKGGMVPMPRALPTGMPHAAGAMPRRSFAAQVAHHLSREYFDEGGPVHGSYDFPAMDLRPKKKQEPRSEGGAKTTMFIPHDYHPSDSPSQAQHEGDDSEGKPTRKLRLNQGGWAAQDRYDPTADSEGDDDGSPDTDQSIDSDEEGEGHYFAEGGVADESEGLDTSKTPDQIVAAGKKDGPNARQRVGAALSAFGSSMGGGPAAFKLSDLKDRKPAAPAAMPAPAPMPTPASATLPPVVPQNPVATAAMAEGGTVVRDGVHYALRPGETEQDFHKHMDALAKKHNPTPAQVRRDDARPIQIGPEAMAAIERDPEGKNTPPGAGSRTWAHGGRNNGPSGPILRTDIKVREPGEQKEVAQNFEAGGGVPGTANVPGNSLKNDVVDAKLSPGEIVLPRTVARDPKKAKKFVEHLLNEGGTGHDALQAIKRKS